MENYNILSVHAGKGKTVGVKVDNEDYSHLSQWTGWQLNHPKGYVRRTVRKDKGKYGNIYMHRLLCGATGDCEVDHINGDRLDNRKQNLRIVSRSENLLNRRVPSSISTTGYIGVERHRDKFAARIRIKGKRIFIGNFNTAEEASEAYQKYKIKNVPSYKNAIKKEAELQKIRG